MCLNILLTGASGGVGKEIVKILHSIPVKLFITAKSEEKLSTVIGELKRKYNKKSQIISLPIDFADVSNIEILVSKVNDFFGNKLDILINNAGIGYHCQVENIQQNELEEVFKINALAPIMLTSRLLPILKKSTNPKIINVSSILGSKGIPYTATYTASKHALNGFSEVLRKEFVNDNLKVILVEPGAIESDFILRTHDEVPKNSFQSRKLEKLKPKTIASWILKIIESDNNTCPELIRIMPQYQIM